MDSEGNMKKNWNYRGAYLTVALMLTGAPSLCFAASPAANASAVQVPADDTGRNVRDREEGAKTADQQSNSKADLEITRKIRRAIVEDKSLSTSAHNVKIVTVDGVVTLRGPVVSSEEKASVAAKARKIAGVSNVENQIEVAKP
jgi:hyperosmotically inducible periplasmic protein